MLRLLVDAWPMALLLTVLLLALAVPLLRFLYLDRKQAKAYWASQKKSV